MRIVPFAHADLYRGTERMTVVRNVPRRAWLVTSGTERMTPSRPRARPGARYRTVRRRWRGPSGPSPYAAARSEKYAPPPSARSNPDQRSPWRSSFSRRSKEPNRPPRLSIMCTRVASRVHGSTGLPCSSEP